MLLFSRHVKKEFVNEYYIDKHMHNKHEDALEGVQGGYCLADFCPIVGCSSFSLSRHASDVRLVSAAEMRHTV